MPHRAKTFQKIPIVTRCPAGAEIGEFQLRDVRKLLVMGHMRVVAGSNSIRAVNVLEGWHGRAGWQPHLPPATPAEMHPAPSVTF